MKFHCVSTMNEEGWNEHGRRMAQSFVDRWTRNAHLTIYAEGFEPDVEGIEVRRLPPWLDGFKEKYRTIPALNGRPRQVYDFRYDLVKFSHKVAALTDFGLGVSDGVMIWLDADIYTHSPIDDAWLTRLFPEPAYLAWLERQQSYPETGFVMFRASHLYHTAFMASLQRLYTNGDVLKLDQQHDAFVIWELAKAKIAKSKIPPVVSLSGEAWRSSHPCINGPLSSKIDHAKGDRKKMGRSPRQERTMIRDGHPYWA